ncbi:hypothetical protein CBW54_17590 [Yersinia kristensenii]|nr:hypothetical protein CBW54_17590 [Yersinia kristensenii]
MTTTITDWHQSRDFIDYNERPANGYDLRAEAYLPSYPQLGGKVMYEKYRGDEVALFGKDNRQKNPHAITAGINYTPIPLVTIGAEHRAGKSGQNDSSINIQLNYRLGETWQSHIDPSAVATSRALAGSRYDLVERNNHIVLDYQKQNLVRLSLPESLAGDPFSQLSITAQVTAKYGLERVDWRGAELIAAGGVLKQTSKNGLEITLPEYQVSRTSGNSYILNAIAYDTQGNVSNQASMLITVNEQKISISNSTLVAAPVSIEANGSDTSVVTLTLRDSNNNPVTGQSVAFASTLGSVGSVTEQGNGVYTATLTAGTVAGLASLSVHVGGSALGVAPATVTLNGNSGDLSTTNSTLVAAPVSIEANGSDTSVVTLTLRDSNNNPVTGQSVAFASTLGSVGSVTEQGNGVYTATLTAGTVAGLASLSVHVGGSALGVAPATVNLIPPSVDLTVSVDNARKNIGQVINLTVTAKYKNTNVIAPDVKITFEQVAVVNRQNGTVSNSGVVQIDGANYNSFTGVTGANGQLTVSVTDPNGIGVQTTLRAKAESGDTGNTNVIFNVITSPDSAQANMWGYMAETLTASGVTFKRPYLAVEKPGTIGSNVENNETWAMFNQSQAVAMCTLPTNAKLQSLYSAYPSNKIKTVAGWPTGIVYRSSTSAGSLGGWQHYYVYMNTGATAYNSVGDGDANGHYNVSCSL